MRLHPSCLPFRMRVYRQSRWWVFGDGRHGRISLIRTRTTAGSNGGFLSDIDRALQDCIGKSCQAAADPDGPHYVQFPGRRGRRSGLGGHADIVTDTSRPPISSWTTLSSRCLRAYCREPYIRMPCLVTDVVNRTRSPDPAGGLATGPISSAGPAQLALWRCPRHFVAQAANCAFSTLFRRWALRRSAPPCRFGQLALDGASAGLDFYQAHIAPRRWTGLGRERGYRPSSSITSGYRRTPGQACSSLGEFPTADASYGLDRRRCLQRRVVSRLYFKAGGHAGALGWSLAAGDGCLELDTRFPRHAQTRSTIMNCQLRHLIRAQFQSTMSRSARAIAGQGATFTVTRSGGTAAFDVNYATSNGTATVADGDYVAASNTLHFGANQNTQTISVTINGDTKVEANETFNVGLSNATNGATISDGQGVGTITNDDGAATPNLVVNGGFESGNFSGWTLSGNSSGNQIYIAPTDFPGEVHTGSYSAGFGSMNRTDGILTQNIATTAGQHYTLSFWIESDNNGSTPINHFAAEWNGQTLMALTDAPNSGYQLYTFDVVGINGNSVLEFDGYNQPRRVAIGRCHADCGRSARRQRLRARSRSTTSRSARATAARRWRPSRSHAAAARQHST